MRPIVVTSIRCTCGACPSQWEGHTEDHRQVYIRYRWGYLSVYVSAPHDTSEYAAVYGEEVLGIDYGDEFDGCMGYETLRLLCVPSVILPEYSA